MQEKINKNKQSETAVSVTNHDSTNCKT